MSINNKSSENFSKKLKKLRIRSGLTQAELAKRLKVSQSTIGMYEQGRREPKKSVLKKICTEFKKLNINNNLDSNSKEQEFNEIYSDINNIATEFIEFLQSKKNILINGMPICEKNSKKIASAVELAIAITMQNENEDDKYNKNSNLDQNQDLDL